MLQKCSWKAMVIVMMGLLAGGCLMAVGAMVGVGAYQWMEGTMIKDYPRTMEPTWHACVAACKTMGLAIKRESYSPTHSKITAATKDDTTVDIELIARPNNITTVKVRFGFMGNKDQSAYFHRNVMKNLGIE